MTKRTPGNCRILVEFEPGGVRVYFCNRAGKILDEECFSFKESDTPEDSYDRASVLHALIYDSLNYGINGRSSSKGMRRPE
jgi:hypothetical protein